MNPPAIGPIQRSPLVLLLALGLIACNPAPPEFPDPVTTAPRVETPPAGAGGSDPSVPDAGSVLPQVARPEAEPAAGRTNGAMSRAQESSAMPMPGQNNDHSAPLSSAKRASAP